MFGSDFQRRLILGFVCCPFSLWMLTAKAQEPLPPIESMQQMRIDSELEVQLVASEPMVQDPVAICWDASGAMYVAEMGDYPASESGGRIRRLVDVDGDGKADQSTIFADNVAFPTSVLPMDDGILVAAAPDILWFRDSDGDGLADVRKVVVTGFGTGNQQLRVNGLTWGLDNFIYGANGRSDGEINFANDTGNSLPTKLSIRSSDFRFRPSTRELQLAGGFTQFGQSFDDFGQRFISWNTIHIRHVAMEQKYLSNNPRAAVTATAREISDGGSTPRVYPISSTTPRFNAEPPGFFNASCGLTIYRGDMLPPEFHGNAFACEPLSNLVHRDVLEMDGPSFVAKRADSEDKREFLASTDVWFRPVNLATGPDGALYVVDFYRKWVEHPQWVADETARKSVDFTEGKEFGRIYRITPKRAGVDAKSWNVNLEEMTPDELVHQLSSTNAWQRETAQRILVEKGVDDSLVKEISFLANKSPSERTRLHALGTLQGSGLLNTQVVLRALSDPSLHVRRFAIQLSERMLDERAILERVYKLAEDSDEAVSMQVACALGFAPRTAETATALAKILHASGDNPWMRQAVFTAAGSLTLDVALNLQSLNPKLDRIDVNQLQWLEEFVRSEATTTLPRWKTWLERANTVGHWKELVVVALLRAQTDYSAQQRIAQELKSIPELLRRAKLSSIDPNEDLNARLLAIALLEFEDSESNTSTFTQLLSAEQPMDVQLWATAAISGRPSKQTAAIMIQAVQTASPTVKRNLMDSMIGRKELRGDLVQALANKELAPNELDPLQRQILLQRVDASEQTALAEVFKSSSSGTRAEVTKKYLDAFQPNTEFEQGHQLYRQHCQSCHARNGEGNRVGPDLTGVAGRSPQDILIDILDPNRSVSAESFSYAILTQDDRVVTGLIAAESSSSITLKQAGGKLESILRSDIREFKRLDKSLMPEGFEESMTPQQLASLISFLKQPLSE